jgi:hypothetical protein
MQEIDNLKKCNISLRSIFALSSNLRTDFSDGLFPSSAATTNLHSILTFQRSTCQTHLAVLDLIALIRLNEKWKLPCNILPILLFPRQIFSQPLSSRTSSIYIPNYKWYTKTENHIKVTKGLFENRIMKHIFDY